VSSTTTQGLNVFVIGNGGPGGSGVSAGSNGQTADVLDQ
jgi:hypothetical protein